jgi:hypothetical protein
MNNIFSIIKSAITRSIRDHGDSTRKHTFINTSRTETLHTSSVGTRLQIRVPFERQVITRTYFNVTIGSDIILLLYVNTLNLSHTLKCCEKYEVNMNPTRGEHTISLNVTYEQ